MKYRPGKTREESVWEVRSPLPQDEFFMDAHISALLEMLEPKKNVIKVLQLKFESGINCVGYYTVANPGFHMDSQLIQKLAEWNVPVDFDLYCYCDCDDEENKA